MKAEIVYVSKCRALSINKSKT